MVNIRTAASSTAITTLEVGYGKQMCKTKAKHVTSIATYIVKMVNPSQGSVSAVWQSFSLIRLGFLPISMFSNCRNSCRSSVCMWSAVQEAGRQIAVLTVKTLAILLGKPNLLPDSTSAKQYLPRNRVPVAATAWSIRRHSSKLPRSLKLPCKIPDGREPQASITKVVADETG